jgi:hypothetical protein
MTPSNNATSGALDEMFTTAGESITPPSKAYIKVNT